jgi:hypothetical protein
MLAAVRSDGVARWREHGRLVRAVLLDGLSGSGPYGALLGLVAGVSRRSRLSIRLRRRRQGADSDSESTLGGSRMSVA